MQNKNSFEINEGPVALNRWCSQRGISPITAWRWRKKGWLRTVNISGRQYVTQESIAQFNERAERGEFAAEHKVPVSPRAV